MHCDCFKKFQDLTFVDNELPMRTEKITFFKNLYAYSIHNIAIVIHIVLPFKNRVLSENCTHVSKLKH